MTVSVLFFDVGGVLLSNGWDRVSRRHCIGAFGLDWEEFQDRHEFVSESFETGSMTLDDYLDRTVFYRARSFSRQEFIEGMYAESYAIPGTLEFVSTLKGRYLLCTLNNESRELNQYRTVRSQGRLRSVLDVVVRRREEAPSGDLPTRSRHHPQGARRGRVHRRPTAESGRSEGTRHPYDRVRWCRTARVLAGGTWSRVGPARREHAPAVIPSYDSSARTGATRFT